jgi:hypothetical protein
MDTLIQSPLDDVDTQDSMDRICITVEEQQIYINNIGLNGKFLRFRRDGVSISYQEVFTRPE